MKTLIAVTALTLAAGLANAGDFAYERQIGSPDVSSELSTLQFRATDPAPSAVQPVISLHRFYAGNPDVEVLPEDYRESKHSVTYCNSSYDRIAMDNPDLSPNC